MFDHASALVRHITDTSCSSFRDDLEKTVVLIKPKSEKQAGDPVSLCDADGTGDLSDRSTRKRARTSGDGDVLYADPPEATPATEHYFTGSDPGGNVDEHDVDNGPLVTVLSRSEIEETISQCNEATVTMIEERMQPAEISANNLIDKVMQERMDGLDIADRAFGNFSAGIAERIESKLKNAMEVMFRRCGDISTDVDYLTTVIQRQAVVRRGLGRT